MILGYARVSTADQNLDSQREALLAAGCSQVFNEKISGVKKKRKELENALASLMAGDTLMVTRLDRLARSTLDLLTIIQRIGESGAMFKSLADAWCDTTTPHGRLMLTVLGGLAEFERELIKARTGEGRKRAQAAGVKFGAPVKVTAAQREEILGRYFAGASLTKVGTAVGVNRSTVKRVIDQARSFPPESPADYPAPTHTMSEADTRRPFVAPPE